MEDKILKLLGRRDCPPLTLADLLHRLHLPPSQQQEVQRALRNLEQQGKVVHTKRNRYIQAREANLVPGVIRINRQGKGFLQPEEDNVPEIMVPESATGTALDGDRVLVRRDAPLRRPPLPGDAQATGAVVRILSRKRTQLVGTLQQSRRFFYVIPDDPRIPHDIYVPPARDVGRPANVGDKVVVELRDWESRHTNPEGEIVEVLGAPDEEGVDLLSVIRQYNLPMHFPREVLHEANAIAKGRHLGEPRPEELRGRVDCREHQVVTIDPADAKDFDDAICLKELGPNRWRLWVHIADVSTYVKPGTALDREAQKRGNSTYLVDRVIPMVPEALSNEVCSLNPGVDRLTRCAEFRLSDKGDVLEVKFYPAVIRSKRRYNYKEALAVLHKPPSNPIEQMLHHANEMAQRLRRKRFQTGALDLDMPETKIILDAHGQISEIEKVESDISHQLIEEYMLLANEAVAAELKRRKIPAVYRVHESPDERRLREYREEVVLHRIHCGNLNHRPEMQKLLQHLKVSPLGPALTIAFLKSLMRARYAIQPLGHYGLNKKDYAHFTSPIRRYADLVVHRALFDRAPVSGSALKKVADHISETERNSDDAERDSKQVKLYAYLEKQLRSGQLESYHGLIMDVRNFGFFVDVPGLGMSGLVHLSSVEDDFFVFDAPRAQLVGRRTRRVIKLGDKVLVQVDKVDKYKKQVDFRLVKPAKPVAAQRPQHGPRTERPRREDRRRREETRRRR